MRRRNPSRDPRLTARMALALILVAGLYALLVAALYGCYLLWPAGWPYWLFVAVVLVATAILHYRGAERLLLRSVGATFAGPREEPELHRALERLAQLADLPVPRLAVAETEVPNAFAVGLTRERAVVVVTRGLAAALTGPELDAVLAHELSHLANHDAVVLTVASVPRTTGHALVDTDGTSGLLTLLVWPLGVPLVALGTLITLTISRYREFAADRGSAVLTGAPEQLMSALQKLSAPESIPELDLRGLAGVEAFCIVPVTNGRRVLLMDHPPLERRLAALASIARDLGKVG